MIVYAFFIPFSQTRFEQTKNKLLPERFISHFNPKNKMRFYSLLLLVSGLLLTSCKTTVYTGSFGQVNQTQVQLSNANFRMLGSFSGMASERLVSIGVKNKEGLISQAKADLLAKAKAAGVELTGSRTLTNIAVDVIQNPNRVTLTLSADIIEFTK